MRLLRTCHEAASRVAVLATGKMPPTAILALLESAAADDAGDRSKPPVPDAERREVAHCVG